MLVRSQSDDLLEAERTHIQAGLEEAFANIDEVLEEPDLDITVNPMEISCTFSDLNGVCGDTDRSFSQELSSLLVMMDQLKSIDLEHPELNDISLVDEALASISLSRAQLGAMFERFTILMMRILDEHDLYAITLHLMDQQETLAMISTDDSSSDEDREFINAVFTQLRDESVRISACHSCDLNLDDMDLSDCEAGSCLSVETQDQATEALEGIEMMNEQLSECL